jgi:hypothetical protein
MDRENWRNLSPYLTGVGAASGLIVFYLAIMTLTADWFYARIQFEEFKWWIIALSIGVGVQAALFTILKRGLRQKEKKAARSALAASGGVSTASMAACCLHHLTDVIPVLGFPLLAVALQKYQVYFFLLGVLSNAYGILVMLRLMAQHDMIRWRPFLRVLVGGPRQLL